MKPRKEDRETKQDTFIWVVEGGDVNVLWKDRFTTDTPKWGGLMLHYHHREALLFHDPSHTHI